MVTERVRVSRVCFAGTRFVPFEQRKELIRFEAQRLLACALPIFIQKSLGKESNGRMRFGTGMITLLLLAFAAGCSTTEQAGNLNSNQNSNMAGPTVTTRPGTDHSV